MVQLLPDQELRRPSPQLVLPIGELLPRGRDVVLKALGVRSQVLVDLLHAASRLLGGRLHLRFRLSDFAQNLTEHPQHLHLDIHQ